MNIKKTSQKNTEEDGRSWKIYLPVFKIIHKAIIIKPVCYYIRIEKKTKEQNKEFRIHIQSFLIYVKCAIGLYNK